MSALKHDLLAAYHDYFNNFLTIASFAEHYGLTLCQAGLVIDIGRSIERTSNE